MKKLLALVLMLALVVPATLVVGGFAETSDPVEFTYYRSGLNRNAITYYNDTLWVKELESRMNVKVNIIGPATGDDYNTAVNILLASDNYPEMVYMNWNNYNGGLRAAIDDGIVVDISANEEYKSLMPTWFGMLDADPQLYRCVTLDDGTSAMFCHTEPDLRRAAYGGYAIRKDWLDNLGLEIPDTIDDLYAVLTAFKTEDANGNSDADDEIPLTDDSDKGLMQSLIAAWGLRYNKMYPDPETGKITYWTEYKDGEPFLDCLATLAKWYQEGLIDSEFASQDSTAKEAKITSDQAGMYFAYTANYLTWEDALVKYKPELDGKVCIYGLVPLAGADGKHYGANDAHVRPAAATEGTCVTNKAVENGNIEAILKLIDFMYTDEGSEIINWGVEGVSYTKDAEGNHQWTDLVTKDPEFSFGDAVFKYALPTWGSWPKKMSYEAWYQIEVNCDDSATATANYWAADTSLLIPELMMNQDEAETFNQIKTDADTAAAEIFTGVILGTKTIDDAREAIQTIQSMGIDNAISVYQNVYDRFNAK